MIINSLWLIFAFYMDKGVQVRELISQIRTCPDRRHAIISDLYRLHCDGMTILIFLYFNYFSLCHVVEVVLSKNEAILHTMIDNGILEILVDVMSSDSDPDTLVC